jgi:hypothetical protein
VKRFILVPVLGDGSDANPYRADVPAGTNHVAMIPTNPATGVPTFAWALVKVAGTNLTDALSRGDAFPDLTLDANLSSLTNQQRTRIRTFLENRGVTTSVTASTTLRQLLAAVAGHLEGKTGAIFDGGFDVAEA